ncbi:peptide ABC transporter ATP-binding protein [Acuticoccus sediminis]|uniref:Peptide ABC transporter ATP-binding protein n=1 Tax=Acuticoccus sediminis TaxID=2184697 RepID=A0A8B2NM12_9HYPH|nr:ABC transporter ATP-binding protein [Acuticoccus sediminis]RAH97286.1 peptide ABC transporter ATP-binding protein [Acuticoccus sediminis]
MSVIEEAPAIAGAAATAAPVLAIDGLKTQFFTRDGIVRAVDGVSFDVRRGETVGVVGESGSGKSVTALSIMRLLSKRTGRIVDGTIRLGAEDIVGASEPRMRQIRGKVASMIFQEPMTSLNPVLKIGYQITETIRVHEGLGRAEARRRAVEMLRLVRIPEPERRIAQYPFELSGGMRQRVMIAMALACNPQLLIADEATTALDVTIQAQILQLILELRQKLGMAVIMITHDLGVVAETCDRLVVMYAGKVVERGTVREVFRRPLHPYTKGLLASIPRLPQKGAVPKGRRGKLVELPGFVPSLRDVPAGCRFAPRCALATDRCRAEEPPLMEMVPGRLTACFEAHRLMEGADA